MKNIHIIPTSQPSRLLKNTQYNTFWLSTEFLHREVKRGVEQLQYQNIYITSDEEIKEGVDQWYLDKVLNEPYNSGGAQYASKQDVIILTTDQDLIKDGVQEIDDEFLEWFVKNPSCEEIQVEKSFHWDNGVYEYEIIIPKEEPKQELHSMDDEVECNMCGNIMSLLENESNYACSNSECTRYYEEPDYTALLQQVEQETLEEAGVAYSKTVKQNHTSHMLGFVNGAKWQAERSYSEEDMEDYSEYVSLVGTPKSPKDWFEQFKKK